MKILNLLYFGIYNFYYKDGNFKSGIPSYTSMMIFAGCFFANISFLILLFSENMNAFPFGKSEAIMVAIACAFISFFLFVWKKKYERIYNEFKDSDRRTVHNFFSWLYVCVSFLLLILPPMLRMIL